MYRIPTLNDLRETFEAIFDDTYDGENRIGATHKALSVVLDELTPVISRARTSPLLELVTEGTLRESPQEYALRVISEIKGGRR